MELNGKSSIGTIDRPIGLSENKFLIALSYKKLFNQPGQTNIHTFIIKTYVFIIIIVDSTLGDLINGNGGSEGR